MTSKLSSAEFRTIRSSIKANPLFRKTAHLRDQQVTILEEVADIAAHHATKMDVRKGEELISMDPFTRFNKRMMVALGDTDVKLGVTLEDAELDSPLAEELIKRGLIQGDTLCIHGFHLNKGALVGTAGFLLGRRTAAVIADRDSEWGVIDGGLQASLAMLPTESRFAESGRRKPYTDEFESALLAYSVEHFSDWLKMANQDAVAAGFKGGKAEAPHQLNRRLLNRLPHERLPRGHNLPLRAGRAYFIEEGGVNVQMKEQTIAMVPANHIVGERMLVALEDSVQAPYNLETSYNGTMIRTIDLHRLRSDDRMPMIKHAARTTVDRTRRMNITATRRLMRLDDPEAVKQFFAARDHRAKSGEGFSQFMSRLFGIRAA